MAESTDQKSPLEIVREECLKKGVSGFASLGKLFKELDTDDSNALSVHEFINGLQDRGYSQKKVAIYKVFKEFDADDIGSLDFEEFLRALRPPISSEFRLNVVKDCFATLDIVKDGVINIEDMRGNKCINIISIKCFYSCIIIMIFLKALSVNEHLNTCIYKLYFKVALFTHFNQCCVRKMQRNIQTMYRESGRLSRFLTAISIRTPLHLKNRMTMRLLWRISSTTIVFSALPLLAMINSSK